MIHRPRLQVALALTGALAIVLAACATGASSTPTAAPVSAAPATATPTTAGSACPTSQPPALPAGETRTVVIETAKGSITIKVEADLGPLAAGNFVALAACGFYDGVVFHRVVPGFVIQGGDPTGTGSGGPGYEFANDPVTAPYARGVVAMANAGRDTNGSQFFIVLADSNLPPDYSVFGRVTAGMEAVDAIAAAADAELPTSPIAMDTVTVSNP
ncbi:MAG: peptidylprolyl isomerase [Anaerolinea sp.]|nr:peptidylprolyl isomerase [Anaerolinea sp.]